MTTAPPRPLSTGLPGLVDGAWKLAEALAHPVVPTEYLDMFAPLRAGAELRAKIIRIRPETADAATIVLRPGRSWRTHRPGQYIRIGVDIDGVRHWRAYSLTSARDTPDGTITITVKAMTDGRVSTHLVHHATPGTLVMLDQATGDFVLPAQAPAKALFVTAGSGITPVMGMLRNHLRAGPGGLRDVVVVHSAPRAQDIIFAEELRHLAAVGSIRLLERHTDLDGMLDLSELDDLVPDWRDRETWTCGPTALLDDAETHWARHDLASQLHVERFRPSVIEPGDGGTITFSTGVTVESDGSTPILDAGEDAGVLMRSGCRMGICFGCVVTMREGAVRDLRTGDVTTADAGDNLRIQTCINAVAGRCDLDLTH